MAERWDRIFSGPRLSDANLAQLVQIQHEARQYEQIVACLEAALRAGRVVPWLYDVLALEMKLAGRPADEVARVLQSRLDFGAGGVPQMLITAAMLSRFEAWQQALTLLRDGAQLNPENPELWLLARSIADKSGDQEWRVWSRCGVLQHVWDAGYQKDHDEALKVLTDIAKTLDKAGKSPEAEAIRSRQLEARRVDLQISLKWVGAADLDLIVRDPQGAECSFRKRITPTFGRLVREDGNANPKLAPAETHAEVFLQPKALNGKYEFSVRFVVGKVTTGTAVVEVIQNGGTPAESRETKTIRLGEQDVSLSTEIKQGRWGVVVKP
jgi:tetratricopeptide (TPR) repeat protein